MYSSYEVCEDAPSAVEIFHNMRPTNAKTKTATKKNSKSFSTIPENEIKAALEHILSSRIFRNAVRKNQLLRYLIEKAMSGEIRETSEYIIGVEVFDRNPVTYNTNSDPIVRVQIGRLREKLKIYYTTVGVDSSFEILIPIGSYMPVIERKSAALIQTKQSNILIIKRFKCIPDHGDGAIFTQGLNDELMHQLFKGFGGKILPYSPQVLSDTTDNEECALKYIAKTGINHLLEGSVQIDAERIRVSIRLVDIAQGCIIWSERFDRKVFFAISLQEEIAKSICKGLKSFFHLK